MSVWEDLKKPEREKKGKRVCACMSVWGEAMPVRRAILCSRDGTINLEARYGIDQQPSMLLPFHICAALSFHLRWDPSSALHLRPLFLAGLTQL